MKNRLLLLTLVSTFFAASWFGGTLKAQTYALQVVPSLGSGNNVILDVQIRSTTGTYALGPSSIIFNVPASSIGGCIQASNASLVGGSVGTFISNFTTSSNPTPSLQYYVGNGITVSGNSAQITINVLATGVNNGANSNTSVQVPGSFTTLVKISVPILNCGNGANCLTTSANLAGAGGLALAGNSALTQYDFSGGFPFYSSITGTFNVAPGNFSLLPPSFNGPSTITVFACSTGISQPVSLQGGALGYISIKSSIGSTINSGSTFAANTNSTTYVINNVPTTPVVDTIYVRNQTITSPLSPGASSSCASTILVTVNPPPSIGFSLSAIGGANVCTSGSTGSVTIRLSGSQSGVTYQLLQDGVPVGTVNGTGGAVNFPVVSNLSPKSLPGYNFTYRVTSPCVVAPSSSTPGLNVNVVNCTLSGVGVNASVASPTCGNQSVTFTANVSGTTPAIPGTVTPSYIWSTTNAAITFPNGNAGSSVTAQLGINASQQVGNINVQVQYTDPTTGLLVTGNGTLSNYTVNAAPNPSITGPAFVFLNGASVNATYSTANVGGDTYLWDVPSGPGGSSIATPNANSTQITFVATGSYTVRVRQIRASAPACTTTVSYSVVVNDCNADPGTVGPNQSICFGNSAAVYSQNVTASDGLQWQSSTDGVSWSNASGIGANGTVFITPTSLPLGVTYFRLVARGQPPVLPNSYCESYSQPISVNVQSPPTPGSITDANGSVTPTVCKNTNIQLTLNGGSGTITWQQSASGFTWATASGTGLNTTTFNSTLLTSNTYFRAKRSNGCDSTFSNVVYVQVGNNPAGVITTGSLSGVCAGATSAVIQSTASPAGATGVWSAQNGSGTFTALSLSGGTYSTNYISSPSDAGRTVTLQWVVTSGNCPASVSTININVTQSATGSAITTPASGVNPAAICAGGLTTTLNATATQGVGVWDDGGAGGTFFPNSSATSVNYQSSLVAGPRNVTLRWTVTNGTCPPVADTRVVAINTSSINGTWVLSTPTGNPPDICFSSSAQSAPLGATAVSPTVGSWNTGSVTGSFRNQATGALDPTNPNAVYRPSTTDQGTAVQLVWTVNNPSAPVCGTQSFTKFLTVGLRPTGSISMPDTIRVCYNGNIRLSATVTGGTNTVGTWKLYPFGSGTTPTVPPPAGTLPLAANIVAPSITLSSQGTQNLTSIYTPAATDSNRAFLLYWVVSSGTGASACPSDSFYKILVVSGNAVGDIRNSSPLAQICAGTTSANLNGVLGDRNIPVQVRLPFTQTFFSGQWLVSTNGNGFFANRNSPSTVYLAANSDAGKVLTLTYRVNSAGCGTRDYSVTLPVSNSQVTGAFGTGPNQGLGVPLGSVCVGNTTAPLGGTTGTGSVGTWSTTNGAGSFVNPSTGAAAPNLGSAVYRPVAADSNKTINLVWTISDPSGQCNSSVITRPLDVRPVLRGRFTAVPTICYPSPSSILNVANLGDSRATPSYFALNGAGTFVPNNTLRQVRYFPDSSDIGKTLTLMLILNNGACTPDTQRQQVFVAGAPLINITSNTTNACAGDSISLTATGATIYSWTAAAPSLANINSVTASRSVLRAAPTLSAGATSPGTVRYTLNAIITDPLGGAGRCAYQQTFDQTVIPGTAISIGTGLTVASASATSTNFCQNQDFIATIQGGNDNGALYRWRITPSANTAITNASTQSPTFNISAQGNFTIVGEARTRPNGCISVASINVTIAQNITPIVNGIIVATNTLRVCQDTTRINGANATIPLSIVNAQSLTCTPSMWFAVPPSSLPPRPLTAADTNNASLGYIRGSFSTGGGTTIRSVNFPIRDTVTNAVWTFYCGGACDIRRQVRVTVNPNPAPQFQLFSVDPSTRQSRRDSTRTRTLRQYSASSQQTSTLLELPNFAKTVGFVDRSSGAIVTRQWDFGDPASGIVNNTSTDSVTQHAYTSDGTYTVVLYVTNQQNCSRFASASNVLRIKPVEFFFPTAFSPNNDGINDVFQALPLEANPLVRSLQVFDKNGQQVFQYTVPENVTDANQTPGSIRNPGWNGRTLSGTDFAPGIYSYRAVVETGQQGVTKTYSGNVTLIR